MSKNIQITEIIDNKTTIGKNKKEEKKIINNFLIIMREIGAVIFSISSSEEFS